MPQWWCDAEQVIGEVVIAEQVRADDDVGVGKRDESRCNGDDEFPIGDFKLWSAGVGKISASASRIRMWVAPLSGMNDTAVLRW